MMGEWTPGPWDAGHLCDDATRCNCRYIFGGQYMGALGEIYVDNGKGSISEGANDCPPIDEAKANLQLIAAAPDLVEALKGIIPALQAADNLVRAFTGPDDDIARAVRDLARDRIKDARAALAKAGVQ